MLVNPGQGCSSGPCAALIRTEVPLPRARAQGEPDPDLWVRGGRARGALATGGGAVAWLSLGAAPQPLLLFSP